MYKLFFEKTDMLSPQEQSAVAHSLLRRSLSGHFGVDETKIEIKKDNRGAPFVDFVDGVYVSLTHTKGLVACVFADSRVGVDAERVSMRRKSVENRVFLSGESSLIDSSTDENTAFFTLWTLKESWLKAIGTGFSGNAKEIEFYSLENPVRSNSNDFSFVFEIHGEYIISLCVENK